MQTHLPMVLPTQPRAGKVLEGATTRPRRREADVCGRVIQATPANAVANPYEATMERKRRCFTRENGPQEKPRSASRGVSKDARRPLSGGDSPPRVPTRRGVAQTRPCGDRARQSGLPGRGKITQVHRAGGWMVRTRDATRRTPGDPVVQGAEAVMSVPSCPQEPSFVEITSERHIPGGGCTSRSRRFEDSAETGEMES